jgi:hypothetical protein
MSLARSSVEGQRSQMSFPWGEFALQHRPVEAEPTASSIRGSKILELRNSKRTPKLLTCTVDSATMCSGPQITHGNALLCAKTMCLLESCP